MDSETITALAREYAEFTDMSDVDKKNISAICECFLKYTLRRYELVEKERLRRVMALHIEKSNEVAKGGETWFFHKGSANTLRYLFHDLGKEVEE